MLRVNETSASGPHDDAARENPGDAIDIPAAEGEAVSDEASGEAVHEVRRRRTRGFFRRRDADDAGEASPDQPTAMIPAVPAAAADAPEAGEVVTVPEEELPRGPHLRRNRAELVDRREDTLFHLGGLVYDLYQRDQVETPAVKERARRVAEIDDAIREIDAQLADIAAARSARRRPEPAGPSESGACLSCRAPFYADARFCMQCGTRLAPRPPGGGAGPAPGETAILPGDPAAS